MSDKPTPYADAVGAAEAANVVNQLLGNVAGVPLEQPTPEFRAVVLGPMVGGPEDPIARKLAELSRDGWHVLASHPVPLVDRRPSMIDVGDTPRVIGHGLYVILQRWVVNTHANK
jgi:hypothetical protein